MHVMGEEKQTKQLLHLKKAEKGSKRNEVADAAQEKARGVVMSNLSLPGEKQEREQKRSYYTSLSTLSTGICNAGICKL